MVETPASLCQGDLLPPLLLPLQGSVPLEHEVFISKDAAEKKTRCILS